MKNRALIASICISTAFFLGFVSLYLYAHIIDPEIYVDKSGVHCPHISLGYNVNATVSKDWGGFLIFFNENLPYTGSVFGLAGDKSISETGWGGCGISFEIIKYAADQHSRWTLMISLWYPLVIFAILPAVYVMQKLRGTKRSMASSSPTNTTR